MATSNADGPIKISKRIEKELHQTKVVIRRLPPDITEEKLLEMLPDIPPYSFSYFVAGDPSLGNLSFSRAYFSFTDEASILPFRDKYDGIFFESEKGAKYRAVVEFAPYQGVPKRQKRKADARIGTIEQDTDYKAFLETAEDKLTPPTMNELAAYVDTIGTNKVPEVQKTPLVSYLESRGRGSRFGKRSKPSSDSKKKYGGKESSKPSKESRKESGGSKGSSRESRTKTESREGKERPERHKEKEETSSKDRPASSERRKDRERGSREKRSQPRYEENGDVKTEGERKTKESQVKNKDRPDQAIYSPKGKQRNHDRDRNDYKESGRSKDRESSHRYSGAKETTDYRSSRSGGREYNSEDKPRRGRGWDDHSGSSKERRDGGRRGDGYRKPRESYYDQDSKTSHHREK